MKHLTLTASEGSSESSVQAETYRSGSTRLCIARDSAGTHICREGRFFPDVRGFATFEEARNYLFDHEEEALSFFDQTGNATEADMFHIMVSAYYATWNKETNDQNNNAAG